MLDRCFGPLECGDSSPLWFFLFSDRVKGKAKGNAAMNRRTPKNATLALFLMPFAFCVGSAGRADTFFPMVMSVSPVAVQTGQTSECEITARYSVHGAYRVLVTGTGVTGTAESAAAPKGKRPPVNKIKVRFTVAPDALPGVRDVRLATPQGASTLGQLVIVRDPVIRESGTHNTPQTAQSIPVPAAVCGAIERPEDVDYYKFHVPAGLALTFHVHGQRLEDKIHDLQEHLDPILTLRTATGAVLAVNDNTFAGDPLLAYRFASAGEYVLEVRDARYGGNPAWVYCVEINDRPFVTAACPPRVRPGVTTRLRLVGHNLPADPTAFVSVPAGTHDGPCWASPTLPDGRPTNPVPLLVSGLPDIAEAAGTHGGPTNAQPISVPACIGGCLDKPGEIDCYAFPAKKGERFTIRVTARGLQSALDSFLRVLDDKGRTLAENDDASEPYVHADSLIEDWTVPADGRYVLAVRDLHQRGGPGYVYALEVAQSRPHFRLDTDSDKTLLAPGTAAVIFARVTRKSGFTGEVHLAVEGLPPGVTATCGRILAGGRDGCIVLRAAPDARPVAAELSITGRATMPGPGGKLETLTAHARPLQEIYMPGGGRAHFPAEMHTLTVGDPLDLRAVHVQPASVTLKPGGTQKIDVTIERAPDFKQPVTLDVVYQHLGSIYGGSLPAGVTVDERASQTLLTGEQTKGTIVLRAAADAPTVHEQLVPIMAHVSVNFVVKFTYCGEPVRVSVVK
jgi:hypothetical protein